MTKNKQTIYDCKDVKGVFYVPNKSCGMVSFINCENVTGIEFDLAMKVIDIDISNITLLKYLNIHRTSIKEIHKVPAKCIVYCKSNVLINRLLEFN